MKNTIYTDMKMQTELTESSNVKMTLKQLWALIITITLGASFVVTNQLKTDYKIERLYLSNQAEHQGLMLKLNEMTQKQDLYALKNSVENAFVYVSKLRDDTSTNKIVSDEIKFRQSIRNFLQ